MTNNQYKIIEQSLNNYFKMGQGDLFFFPEIYSTLEDAIFEVYDDWVMKQMLVAEIQLSLVKHFRSLKLENIELIQSTLNQREIEIQLTLRLKEESTDVALSTFNINIGSKI